VPTATLSPADAAAEALTALTFADERTGWAALGERLLVTHTGGASWQPLATLDGPIAELVATSPDIVWAHVGRRLMQSQDGGSTWSELSAQLVGPTLFDAVDALHAWARNVGGALFATDDGGQSWERQPDPCARPGFEPPARMFVDFLSPQLGWALCAYDPGTGFQAKRLVASDDGGRSWREVAYAPFAESAGGFPGSGYAAGFAAGDADHLWLTIVFAGVGQVLASEDGGITWARRSGSENGTAVMLQARSAAQLSGLLTYAGSPWAAVLSDDGGATWRPVYPGVHPYLYHQAPLFIDAAYGFALGTPLAAGAVLATSDGGRSWEQRAALPLDAPGRLRFIDRLRGCAEGEDWHTRHPDTIRRWYETRDGGYTWAEGAAGGRCPA
jgi:photosystem II stability/assembly factor-like uncharacterized protein